MTDMADTAANEIDRFLSVWTRAELEADVATLDAILTEDFVGVGPLGFTLPKAAWLARHRPGGLRYESFDLTELDRRHPGRASDAGPGNPPPKPQEGARS